MDPNAARLCRQPLGKAVKSNRRPPRLVAVHFDVPPPDLPAARKRLQRLVNRLLCREPRGEVGYRVGAAPEIASLVRCQKPGKRPIAVAIEQPRGALDFDQIQAHAESAHARYHQKLTKARSMSGTAK